MEATPATERRRYFRLEPSQEGKPQAVLELGNRDYEVEIVNLSPGGLLCYVHDPLIPLDVDQYIPKVIIRHRDRPPLVYAGHVLRLQHDPQKNQRFCAIEFVQFEGKRLQRGSRPVRPFKSTDRDREFLDRLKRYPALAPGLPLEKEFEIREGVFREFVKESLALPLEERWYFYEVIEEMKRREPDWPRGLEAEFLRLCRGEVRSEFVAGNKMKPRFRSWLRKIWPF